MDIKKFIEGLGENKEELLKKATLCKSADELLALAVENGISLDKAGAIELFETMEIKTGKLSDEELDNVAGGIPRINSLYSVIHSTELDNVAGGTLLKYPKLF